jgi:uncharacterized protein
MSMSTSLLFSNLNSLKQGTFRNNVISETSTSSNTVTLECLGQLQRLDQQIIALQSKLETAPDLKSKQTELAGIKTREQDKVERIQLETNSDKSQKISKELLHLKNLEKGLEFKVNHIKKETEILLTQVTSLQDRHCEITIELRPTSGVSRAKELEIRAEMRELEAQKLHFQGQLPSRYLTLYQKIGANRGGVAIAKVIGTSCGGCHMVFRPQFVIELARSKVIEQCPACKRILLTSLDENVAKVP